MKHLVLVASFGVSVSLTPMASIARAEPASEGLDASFIQPYTASFDFGFHDEEGQWTGLGTWNDSVQIKNGQLEGKVEGFPSDGDQADLVRVVAADQNTLRPSRFEQRWGEGLIQSEERRFDQQTVIVRKSDGEQTSEHESQFDDDLYELSLWATLAMSMDFESGNTVQLPVFLGNDRSAVETFTVGEIESVTTPIGEFTATLVSTTHTDWQFWVRKEAPYIVRIEHPIPGGSGTAVSLPTSFELGSGYS